MEKVGYTAGCPGCRAANRGTTAVNPQRSAEAQLQKNLTKLEMRLERETQRLFEYLEEEENRKKKAKASEDKG